MRDDSEGRVSGRTVKSETVVGMDCFWDLEGLALEDGIVCGWGRRDVRIAVWRSVGWWDGIESWRNFGRDGTDWRCELFTSHVHRCGSISALLCTCPQ